MFTVTPRNGYLPCAPVLRQLPPAYEPLEKVRKSSSMRNSSE